MNRFKFRVWNKITNKMEYTPSLENTYSKEGEESWRILALCSNDPNGLRIIHYYEPDIVLMRALDYFDCNGKQIYEGDIFFEGTGISGDYRTSPGYRIVGEDDRDSYNVFSGEGESFKDQEVLGNIYENPTMIDEYEAQLQLDKEFPTK